MPTATLRRRGRPLKGEIPLSSPERSQRWREKQKRTTQTRLEIWLPVEVAKRIKKEAAENNRRLGAIVAAQRVCEKL
jgi:hypothetical protein